MTMNGMRTRITIHFAWSGSDPKFYQGRNRVGIPSTNVFYRVVGDLPKLGSPARLMDNDSMFCTDLGGRVKMPGIRHSRQ